MRQDLLDAVKPSEERVEFAGHVLVAREPNHAAAMASKVEKGGEDNLYHLMIACLFEEDGTTPALTLDDLPALKAGGIQKINKLAEAVLRVNGMDSGHNQGKPQAGPEPASSTPSP